MFHRFRLRQQPLFGERPRPRLRRSRWNWRWRCRRSIAIRIDADAKEARRNSPRSPVSPASSSRSGSHAPADLHHAAAGGRAAVPFVVYFGMEHVSHAGLRAGARRALADTRAEPDARARRRWMVGAALADCVLLAISGEVGLLRWYPVLISALVLLSVSAEAWLRPADHRAHRAHARTEAAARRRYGTRAA